MVKNLDAKLFKHFDPNFRKKKLYSQNCDWMEIDQSVKSSRHPVLMWSRASCLPCPKQG